MAKWLITSFDLNWEDNNSAPTRSTNDGPAPSQGATDRFINSPIRKNNFFDTLTDSFDSPQHFLFHSPPCVEDIVINFAEWNIFDQTGFVCDILQKPRHVGKDDQFLGFQRRSQNCGSSISVSLQEWAVGVRRALPSGSAAVARSGLRCRHPSAAVATACSAART